MANIAAITSETFFMFFSFRINYMPTCSTYVCFRCEPKSSHSRHGLLRLILRKGYGSEQRIVGRAKRDAQVVVSGFTGDPAARSSLQEADLQEIRFVNVFDGIDFLAQHGGNCTDPDR